MAAINAMGFLVAVLYGCLAWVAYRSIPAVVPRTRPARRFLASVAVIWTVWYVILAVTTPPLLAWHVGLNRTLHIPLVTAIIFNVWVGRDHVK